MIAMILATLKQCNRAILYNVTYKEFIRISDELQLPKYVVLAKMNNKGLYTVEAYIINEYNH